MKLFKKIKHYYQRATRGYSDRDLWSFDMYLAEVILNGLIHIRDKKPGIPCELVECDDVIDASDEDWNKARDKWNETLDKMVEGFRAHIRIVEMDYEAELGAWPDSGYRGKEGPITFSDEFSEYCEKVRGLQKRDQKSFEEGMALFTKYFGALWT